MLELRTLSALACALLIAGCAATPPPQSTERVRTNESTSASRDQDQPANDEAISAENVSPDKPAETHAATAFHQAGLASWYGRGFNGRRTASGERFDMHAMTAAHRTLPLGSWVRVTLLGQNRSVVVRINDRGPVARSRVIDLSYGAAMALGIVRHGTAKVELSTVSDMHIRS
ncbi:septal ring lytic transglycosylase RlpA family protein [Caballeronia sp. J97]|uniref:septal ring lytic transglycosylase RlpA family protein n=1 Tax=Caballeronia sp. J97 TaxID=2805429 RepID=UPI002AAF2967|nr:septal ring lytic transglycosylase RlpA family protein [Caballeronia sp. J97]